MGIIPIVPGNYKRIVTCKDGNYNPMIPGIISGNVPGMFQEYNSRVGIIIPGIVPGINSTLVILLKMKTVPGIIPGILQTFALTCIYQGNIVISVKIDK